LGGGSSSDFERSKFDELNAQEILTVSQQPAIMGIPHFFTLPHIHL
jgi:hypothetical protein